MVSVTFKNGEYLGRFSAHGPHVADLEYDDMEERCRRTRFLEQAMIALLRHDSKLQ